MSERTSGFRGEFLWEWDIAERQLGSLAGAFPAEDYRWKPHASARSVSEVLVHVACGSFMLLEVLGRPAPADIYANLPEPRVDRLWAMVRRNDELERSVCDKQQILPLLHRVFRSVRETVVSNDDASLDHAVFFFGEDTTIRRVYLRLLAHTHEHMGQLIGYMRVRGMSVPWPDWRPDRRAVE